MITIRLGGVPIRFGAEPIRDLLMRHMPKADRHMSFEDRQVYIAQKGFMLIMAPWLYRKMRKLGIPIEAPACPRGEDYITWTTGWMIEALLRMTGGAVVDIDVAEVSDGLLVTGLAATAAGPILDAGSAAPRSLNAPAIGGASTPVAPDGDGGTLPGVASAAPSGGADDRGLAGGSVVRAGPDGQRQDPLREAPGA